MIHRDEKLLDHLENQLFQHVAGISTGKVLPDPVFTIAIETLSEVEGGTLVPLKSAGVGWVESCLISKVTTGLQDWEL